MKTTILRIAFLIILIVSLAFLTGCEEEESSKLEDRVQAFIDDLYNDNWSSLYTHFSATETDDYASLQDPAYWSLNDPWQYGNHVVNSMSTSGSTVSASISWNSGTPQTQTWTFRMVEEGSTWKIEELDLAGSNVINSIL